MSTLAPEQRGRLTEMLPPIRCTPATKLAVRRAARLLGVKPAVIQRVAIVHLVGSPDRSAQLLAEIVRKSARGKGVGGE